MGRNAQKLMCHFLSGAGQCRPWFTAPPGGENPLEREGAGSRAVQHAKAVEPCAWVKQQNSQGLGLLP